MQIRFISFLLLLLVACSDDKKSPQAPKIEFTNVAPLSGGADRLVKLQTAHGFSATKGSNTVTFNGVSGRILSESSDEIDVLVPKNAGTGVIVVNSNGVEIDGPVFTYLEPPSSTTYYYRFKENGVSVNLESTIEPDGSGCANCMCYFLSSTNPARNFALSICTGNGTTATDVEQMAGKSFVVRNSTNATGASISYQDNGAYYQSDQTGESGETIKVIDAKYHSSINGTDSYDVSGTFSLNLTNPDNGQKLQITEGSFLAVYTIRTDL
jgi:hypothetical protein